MLKETARFSEVWKALNGAKSSAGEALVRFLERRFGGEFVYDISKIPLERPALADLFEIAEGLRRKRIIRSYGTSVHAPDEPRVRAWRAVSADPTRHVAGGLSVEDDRYALTAALAESLERYLWFHERDFFESPSTMTAHMDPATALLPKQFAGFTDSQRSDKSELSLRPDAEYLWVRGYSWTDKKKKWVPAQVVSGLHGGAVAESKSEPLILFPITTGLATGVSKSSSVLSGALEVIERDAFMIMWLNQLTLPRVDIEQLTRERPTLSRLVRRCSQYRLRVHFVRLITDAPTHVVASIVEDLSGHEPKYTVGLKAHRSPSIAAEGALLEALRTRGNARFRGSDVSTKNAQDIAHMERISYWMNSERSSQLAFMCAGHVEHVVPQVWEQDTAEAHLERICRWARDRKYELLSVDLGTSAKNPTPWHVHMVVMPELQPMHQSERYQYLGGTRLAEIPQLFGYEPRKVPFADSPHPFA